MYLHVHVRVREHVYVYSHALRAFSVVFFALFLSSHGTTRSDPVLVAIIFTGGWLTSCQADQMERKDFGGAALSWCDLINNNLRGMTNWMEAIHDRAE